jgi:serine/threonine protein kinase
VAQLDSTAKMVILRSVARSVQILHSEGIVHGDLKPDNILLKADTSGGYVARLIDFDNSFLSGNPPADPEDVVGDVVYYSPELAAYVQREPGTGQAQLTPSSDIYALGLIYCRYLTGDLPRWDRREYQYAFLASNAGQSLAPPRGHCSPEFEAILRGMLSQDLGARPRITDVQSGIQKELGWLKGGGTVLAVPELAPKAEPVKAVSSVKPMLKKMGGGSPPAHPAAPAERPKLKINIRKS